jgi:Cu/Ag efflux pump CusA
VIALLGVAVVPTLGQSLLPDFKERDFLMHWVTAPGTSHPEEVRITTEASKELRAIPGVRNFGAHIGQALLADEVYGVHFGENWISIDPKVDYDTTLANIQEVVDGYPGLRRDVQTYLKERIREVLTGGGEAIIVRISGPDLDVLREKAEEVRQAIAGVDGVIEDHVDLQVDLPQVDVKVNLAKAQAYGIKPGDVRRAAATLMAGEEVGDIFRDGKAYDIQVWSKPEVRNSLSDIRGLLIDLPGGGHVRLADVAEVALKPTPNAIEREGNTRKIDVGANVRGRALGAVVGDVEDRLEAIEFPLGYSFDLIGELAERQAANERLQRFAIVAGIGILLLLVMAFGSWRLGLMAFLALPMALVGGLIGAYLGGGIVSLGSVVGFFTVLGIVARNGIMLITHCQHLEREEGETFGPALVLRGAKERLAPILMTALATGLALVPLVIAGDLPGAEIEHPMAIVILGGLVTATLLNLFIIPALYLRFGRGRSTPAPLGSTLPTP